MYAVHTCKTDTWAYNVNVVFSLYVFHPPASASTTVLPPHSSASSVLPQPPLRAALSRVNIEKYR